MVAATDYMRAHFSDEIAGGKWRGHFHIEMFTGFDFDRTMLRIGSMNMLLHGVEQPDVRYRDSLAEANTADTENYSMVLANPAVLSFTETGSGGTDHVWFYDVRADGYSLDDKRTALLDVAKLGPLASLSEDEHEKNNLPDVLRRWSFRESSER